STSFQASFSFAVSPPARSRGDETMMGGNMPSVVVRDVSLNFGAVEVLRQLNLEVSKGEFLVLLGPSGCGKSTLLNCVAGLLEVSAGKLFINDQHVSLSEPKYRGIGMIFQSYAL